MMPLNKAFRKTMVSSQIRARSPGSITSRAGDGQKSFPFPCIHQSPNAPSAFELKEYLAQHHRAYFTLRIEDEELVIWLQEFACISYVDSCLLLVPRQHPDLDASFVKGFYRLGNSLLQTVFNAGSTWKVIKPQKTKNKKGCLEIRASQDSRGHSLNPIRGTLSPELFINCSRGFQRAKESCREDVK